MSNARCPAHMPGILHWVALLSSLGGVHYQLQDAVQSSFFRVKPSTMTMKWVQSAGGAKCVS